MEFIPDNFIWLLPRTLGLTCSTLRIESGDFQVWYFNQPYLQPSCSHLSVGVTFGIFKDKPHLST